MGVTALWSWGLGEMGMASLSELPAVFRAEAFLGQPHRELQRGPWVEDALRAASLALGDARLDRGWLSHTLLRLPGLLCALVLLTLSALWAKDRGLKPAGAILLSAALPVVGIAARHLQPCLLAELALTFFLWSGRKNDWPRGRLLLAQLGSLALLVLSAGMGWGLSLALLLLACQSKERWHYVAALGALTASLIMLWQLQEGYQPLLSAARDPLTLFERPIRSFAHGLTTLVSAFGLWSPLLFFAWLRADSRFSFERRWLALLAVNQMLSSIFFEPAPLVGVLPATILLQSVFCRPAQPLNDRTPWLWALGGMALLLKALGHHSERLIWPQTLASEFAPPTALPPSMLMGYWKAEALLLLLLLLSCSAKRLRLETLQGGLLLLLVALRAQGYSPALANYASLRPTMELARKLSDRAKPARFGLHDPGWRVYADPNWPQLSSMQEAVQHLDKEHPTLLLSDRANERRIAGALSQLDAPLQMRSSNHPEARLLLNRPDAKYPYLPQEMRLDKIPELPHRCRVVFADAVELVGWGLAPELERGGHTQLRLVFRVLAPIRGAAQFIAHIEQRPWGTLPKFPTPRSKLAFPISQWQPGSIVQLHQPIDLPWLMLSPGSHALSIGLARSIYHYEPITFPTAKTLEGSELSWLGKSRKRIVLGQVEISGF